MEQIEWSPPVLAFLMERHGGTCCGSTRADLHRWTINLEQEAATCEKVGHRQVRPMARRLPIQSLAEEVASKVVQGQGDERITWQDEGRVKIAVSAIFPSGTGLRQTVAGRRKRFMQSLVSLLENHGWSYQGRCVFFKRVKGSL